MTEQEIRAKIAEEVRAISFPKPPEGEYADPMFTMLYNAQQYTQWQILEVIEAGYDD
jgi:hypothetical protein